MDHARQLDLVDSQRQSLLAAVDALSPAQQRWRPRPEHWSATEIIEHLVLAERAVIGDIEHASEREDLKREAGDVVRGVLVRLVLTLGVRVTVPAESMRPTGRVPLSALREQWYAQHRALRTFVERQERAGLRRRLFRHPVAGPLDTPAMLRLLAAHLRTHQRQFARLRAAMDAAGAR